MKNKITFLIFFCICSFQSLSAQKYFGENPDYRFTKIQKGFVMPNVYINNDGLLYFSYKDYSAKVSRYLSNGSLDKNFEFEVPGATDRKASVVYEKDGNMFIFDERYFINDVQDRLRKFLPNKTADTSFGNNGSLEIPDKKFIEFFDDFFYVIFYNSVVKKYNYNGEELNSFSIPKTYLQITRSNDGYFYIFTKSDNDMMLVNRLDSDGNKDVGFGTNGDVYCKLGIAFLGNDNSIYVVEYLGANLMQRYITKYNNQGLIDGNFANNGVYSFTYQVPQGSVKFIDAPHVLFEEGNKILLIFGLYGEPNYRGTRSFEGNYFTRLNPDGSPDATFNDTASGLYLKNNPLSFCYGIKNGIVHCWAYWQYGLDAEFMSNQFFRYDQLRAEDLDNPVKIIQNPVKDYLEITFLKDNKLKNLVIFDTSGREVFKGNQSKANVSHLPKGMYYVLVETDSKNFKFKIIKD